MAIGSLALSFFAGGLSILSPCVLPLLPIVLGTAASDHRLGPLALAAGLSISFVTIGLFVAAIGYSVGIDTDVFRYVAALFIVAIGVVLMFPGFQAQLAVASGPIANWADGHFAALRGNGLFGQFWIGVLLGAAWSPCVGPTLGAASLMAAQGRNLPQVGMIMFAFGLGAALPLLGLGMLSREAMVRWRHRLSMAGQGMKTGLGVLLVATGVLILTGLDKTVETALVDASPQWLTDLTTRF
jgi:cytochrome c-type biogenesis protein